VMSGTQRISDFKRAVARLAEALDAGTENPLFIDASIQRFEFSFELAWKALQQVVRERVGSETAGPKPTLQRAHANGLIADESVWLAMLTDRNLSSHTYHEALARELRARLPRYLVELEKLASSL